VKLEIGFKVVLFAVFAGAYGVAMYYSQKARQFPQLIALLTLILIFLSLLGDLTRRLKRRDSLRKDGNDRPGKIDRTRRVRFYKAWLVILSATAAGVLGGFLFSTFFLLAGFPLLLGDDQKRGLPRHLSVAVVLTACIYLIFQYLMGVPLLSGLLIDL
jgi:ABC-type Fe3+ transport system permease subunit